MKIITFFLIFLFISKSVATSHLLQQILNLQAMDKSLIQPVKISEVDRTEFDINLQQKNDIYRMMKDRLGEIDDNTIKSISQEILIGLANTKIQHFKWDLTIQSTIGILKIIKITADIGSTSIHINSKSVRLEQNIPERFETKEICSRSGSRRYVIAGPRERECSYYQVKRDLTQNEINDITNNLLSKAEEAQRLLQ